MGYRQVSYEPVKNPSHIGSRLNKGGFFKVRQVRQVRQVGRVRQVGQVGQKRAGLATCPKEFTKRFSQINWLHSD